MGRIVAGLIAAGYLFVCCLLAGMAVIAVLGFIYPAMDLFNHIQPVLFFGLAGLLVATPIFVRFPNLRALALSVAATGLVASSVIYVPEMVAGLTQRHAPPSGAVTYRLMTFNVFGRNETPEAIVDNISNVDPDIVALQEYSPQVRRIIHPLLIEAYPHFQYCAGGQRAFVGLYAKLPFQPLDEDACSASIMSQDRTARIIVRFETGDGPDFSLATTHNDWPAPMTRQAEQFRTLRNFVAEANLVRHTLNLPTFPRQWYYLRDWRPIFALLPIDHVMTRGPIAIHALETGDPSGSDHVPIIVEFSVGGDA